MDAAALPTLRKLVVPNRAWLTFSYAFRLRYAGGRCSGLVVGGSEGTVVATDCPQSTLTFTTIFNAPQCFGLQDAPMYEAVSSGDRHRSDC